MQDRVGAQAAERIQQPVPVEHVGDDRFGARSLEPLGAPGAPGEGEHLVAAGEEAGEQRAPERAGCSGEQHLHDGSPSWGSVSIARAMMSASVSRKRSSLSPSGFCPKTEPMSQWWDTAAIATAASAAGSG